MSSTDIKDQWLAGAQALAAARFENSLKTIDAIDADALYCAAGYIDAIDALSCAAGYCRKHSRKCGTISPLPLPSVLWKLVEAANRVDKETVHLALIVPDNQFFGNPKVVQEEGKTRLEILYDSLYSARQSSGLMRNRFELVWRSVAVLRAVLDRGELTNQLGDVLVVSINKKICWRVLKLRRWSRDKSESCPIRIERTSMKVSRNYSNMGEKRWMSDLLAKVENQNSVKFKKLKGWTRCMEMLVTNASSETLNKLELDVSAIEHWTWPLVEGESVSWRSEAPIVVPKNHARILLLNKLKAIIKKFLHQTEKPLAVVIENPVGDEIFDHIRLLHRILSDNIQIHYVSGADTTKAAARLAQVLAESNHPQSPAWLDSVPEIQLTVREKLDDGQGGSNTKWIAVVSGNEVVPAGEIYSTLPDEGRRVALAPGIEYVHLHLRRGGEGAWEERYTPHPRHDPHHAIAIEPSDHVRFVEPLARVRPLSEVARIEIVEHQRNGEVEALAGFKWDDLTKMCPPELGNIPELYIFKDSEEGWENLKPILKKIVESGRDSTDPSLRITLRDELYECTQEQWRDKKFPLGSDGQPPRTLDGRDYIDAKRLLRDATRILVRDLKYCIDRQMKLKVGVANRLHMGLTWLFTGCPEEVTNILLDAIINPNGKAGTTLHIKKNFAAWSIYSGVGRTVKSEESLKIIYDSLIRRWEKNGGQGQDKFLLAAVSHPLARRFLVREILNEKEERFQSVKHFLCQQLDNIIRRKHDSRPRHQPSLELRYVTMGFRGLCQIRYKNPEWFPVDESKAIRTYDKLMQLKDSYRFRNKKFEQNLIDLSAPYLIDEGEDPTMPGGF